MMPITDGASWWAGCARLEYQRAFDLCAAHVYYRKGHLAILTSSPFYAWEIYKRVSDIGVCAAPTIHSPIRGDTIVTLAPEASINSFHERSVKLSTAVWAVSDHSRGLEILSGIDQVLVPNGRLYLLTAGTLHRLSPYRQRFEFRLAHSDVAQDWLSRTGFEIKDQYGFSGLLSGFWGFLAGRFHQLGREDLADRYYSYMRERMLITGKWARFSNVLVTLAEKKMV